MVLGTGVEVDFEVSLLPITRETEDRTSTERPLNIGPGRGTLDDISVGPRV